MKDFIISPSSQVGSNGAQQAVAPLSPPPSPIVPESEMVPDTPGYYLYQGRLIKVVKDRHGDHVPKTMVYASAAIKQIVTNELGERSYTVTGKGYRSGHYSFEIGAVDFEDGRKLKGQLGSRIPFDGVAADGVSKLPEAIKRVTDPSKVIEVQQFDRVGWNGSQYLIPGREKKGQRIAVPEDLPYYAPSDSLPTRLNISEAFQSLIESLGPAVTTPVLSTMFISVLARRIGLETKRHGVFIVGRTGSLKTAFAVTASAMFGKEFGLSDSYIKWGHGATTNAIMKLATYASDAPLLIDNFRANSGGGVRALETLVHSLIEGRERKRLNRNSEFRDTLPIFCWPIITGESLPVSQTSTLARLIPIEFPWRDAGVNQDLRRCQNNFDAVNEIGRVWIECVERMSSDTLQTLWAIYESGLSRWGDHLEKHHTNMQNKSRVQDSLAVNEMCWQALGECEALAAVADRYAAQHLAGLENCAAFLDSATDNAMEAGRFLSGLRQLLTVKKVKLISNNGEFYDHSDTVIGALNGGHIYLLPEFAVSSFKRIMGDDLNGFDSAGIGRQLDAMGYLIKKKGNGRLKVRKRIDGRPTWVWAFNKNVLMEEDNEQQELISGYLD